MGKEDDRSDGTEETPAYAGDLELLCARGDLLDPEAAFHLVAQGRREAWNLLNLAVWWRTYIAADAPTH